ncbi:MAG: hypothetical protein EPO68_17885, partial [Planctomycetota bacterium]
MRDLSMRVRAALVAAVALLPLAAARAQEPAADAPPEAQPTRHQLPRSREIDALATRALALLEQGSAAQALELLSRLARVDRGLVHAPPPAQHARGVAHWARERWLALARDEKRATELDSTAARGAIE